jgi:hypothetical protein
MELRQALLFGLVGTLALAAACRKSGGPPSPAAAPAASAPDLSMPSAGSAAKARAEQGAELDRHINQRYANDPIP